METQVSRLLAFEWQYQGQRVQAPGGLGGQCVDLINLWAAAENAPHLWANAVDLLKIAPPSIWAITLNTPTNAPDPGAIVVWGPFLPAGIGTYGHTAICLTADSQKLRVLEQNYPSGSPVRSYVHLYGGVLGWLTRLPA